MTEATTENEAPTITTDPDILRARYGDTYDNLVRLGNPEGLMRVMADPEKAFNDFFPTDEDKANVFNMAADMFETLGWVFKSEEFTQELGENLEQRYGVLGKALAKLMETLFSDIDVSAEAYRQEADRYSARAAGETQAITQPPEATAARLEVEDCPDCLPSSTPTPVRTAGGPPALGGMTV